MSDRLTEDVTKFQGRFSALKSEVGKVLVGQDDMLHRLILGLLAGGHVLLEGVPGLAKTLVIRTLAEAVDGTFSRIQFTPDMLPGDVVGTQIFNPREGTYTVRKGPVFGNLILADEINRAPAKVQSALLEAMQEKQVTLGDQTFRLADPFLVLATQNPIEQEGTYPLPDARRRGQDHRSHGRRGRRAEREQDDDDRRDPRRARGHPAGVRRRQGQA